jgi:hypothetical protein
VRRLNYKLRRFESWITFRHQLKNGKRTENRHAKPPGPASQPQTAVLPLWQSWMMASDHCTYILYKQVFINWLCLSLLTIIFKPLIIMTYLTAVFRDKWWRSGSNPEPSEHYLWMLIIRQPPAAYKTRVVYIKLISKHMYVRQLWCNWCCSNLIIGPVVFSDSDYRARFIFVLSIHLTGVPLRVSVRLPKMNETRLNGNAWYRHRRSTDLRL